MTTTSTYVPTYREGSATIIRGSVVIYDTGAMIVDHDGDIDEED